MAIAIVLLSIHVLGDRDRANIAQNAVKKSDRIAPMPAPPKKAKRSKAPRHPIIITLNPL
jgi:hypothetical protein